MSNIKNRLCIICLIIFCAGLVQANPFTTTPSRGGDGSLPRFDPAPVRTTQADENLIQRQMKLRNKLADMFLQWKDKSDLSVLRIILFLAFMYGIFHALGPGHRKTVVFSVYLARKAPITEPGITGLVLALLHGGTAVVVMFVLRGITGAISARADRISRWMEGGSYVVLGIIALILAIRALIELFRTPNGKKKAVASLGALLVSGLYPCPGAILILILALTMDMLFVGVITVFSMSLGMSIPIIIAGYLAWFGRTSIFLGLKAREDRIARISAGIEFAGYLFLLLFSLYMGMPFILSLVRMIPAF